MPDTLTRLCIFTLLGISQVVQAGSSVSDMTCADYLGIDKESRANKTRGDNENISTANKVGFKLGVSMRQGSMANWVQGYLVGYSAAAHKNYNAILDADTLRSKLRVHCGEHQDQTMRQVADEFKAF